MFAHKLPNPQQLAFLAEFGLDATKPSSMECARLLAALRDLETDSSMSQLITPMLQDIKNNLARMVKHEEYVMAMCLAVARNATTSEMQRQLLTSIVEQHLASQTVLAQQHTNQKSSRYDVYLKLAIKNAEQLADPSHQGVRTPGMPEMNFKVGLILPVLQEYLDAYEKSGWFSKLWNLFGCIAVKNLHARITTLQAEGQNVEDRQVPEVLKKMLYALSSVISYFVPKAALLAVRRAISKGFFTSEQQTAYQQEVGTYVQERMDQLANTSFNESLKPDSAEIKPEDLQTTKKDFPRLNVVFQGQSYASWQYDAFCDVLEEKGYDPHLFDTILNNQFFATQEKKHLMDPLSPQGISFAQLADGQQQRTIEITVDHKGVFHITNHGNYSFMQMNWSDGHGQPAERLYPKVPVHVELVEVLSLNSKSDNPTTPVDHSVVLVDHTQGGISQKLAAGAAQAIVQVMA